MSSARDIILQRIGKAIEEGRAPPRSERESGAEARLVAKERTVVPKGANVSGEEAIALFTQKAQSVQTTIRHVAAISDVAEAVSQYLTAKNLPQAIRRGSDPLLDRAGWEAQPLMEVTIGPSDGSDRVGLSVAVSAVAETGTLILSSGPDNPTTLNFLPDHHLVVLPADRIEGPLEQSLRGMVDHSSSNGGLLPRIVNLITGPSRSGDVEQQIVLGAHGPRAVHVILIGDHPTAA